MDQSENETPDTPRTPGAFSRDVLGRLALLGSPVLLLLAISVTGVYRRERARDLEHGRLAARGRVELGCEIFRRELESARSILVHLTGQSLLRRALQDPSLRSPLAKEYLHLCQSLGVLDQLRWIDTDGREVIRIDRRDGVLRVVPAEELQSKADRYYFRGALGLPPGVVYVSRFDLNVEHGEVERPFRPVLRLATTITGDDGATEGVLVANYVGDKLLDWTSALTRPGEGSLWWIDPEGHHLEHPEPDRSWGFVFGLPPSFATESPRAWEAVRSGGEPGFLGEDGLYLSQWVPLGSGGDESATHGLHLVAFTPRSSLFVTSNRVVRTLTIGAGFAALLALGVAWRLGFVGATRAWNERRLEAAERRARSLSRKLLDIEEVERARLARDLHDEVGQFATAVTIDLKRARRSARTESKDECIERALEGTSRLLESMHRISAQLRSSVLDDIGLEAAIESCAEDIERRTEVRVELDLSLENRVLGTRLAENAYRIVQEALTNVVRHAQTDSARVRLEARSDELLLSIEDRGIGFSREGSDGERFGILGMQERAELLGGSLWVRSTAAGGTEVRAVLPLGSPESDLTEVRP